MVADFKTESLCVRSWPRPKRWASVTFRAYMPWDKSAAYGQWACVDFPPPPPPPSPPKKPNKQKTRHKKSKQKPTTDNIPLRQEHVDIILCCIRWCTGCFTSFEVGLGLGALPVSFSGGNCQTQLFFRPHWAEKTICCTLSPGFREEQKQFQQWKIISWAKLIAGNDQLFGIAGGHDSRRYCRNYSRRKWFAEVFVSLPVKKKKVGR